MGDVLQDQMAARLPLAALVVAELSETARIPGARPRPVALPDSPRAYLGFGSILCEPVPELRAPRGGPRPPAVFKL